MIEFKVSLVPEEVKALQWDIVSIQGWLDNAIHSKARQCADSIIELALNDITHTILTASEKHQLVQLLADEGIIINTIEGLPIKIKRLIVQHARIKSAAERDAEATGNP